MDELNIIQPNTINSNFKQIHGKRYFITYYRSVQELWIQVFRDRNLKKKNYKTFHDKISQSLKIPESSALYSEKFCEFY